MKRAAFAGGHCYRSGLVNALGILWPSGLRTTSGRSFN